MATRKKNPTLVDDPGYVPSPARKRKYKRKKKKPALSKKELEATIAEYNYKDRVK